MKHSKRPSQAAMEAIFRDARRARRLTEEEVLALALDPSHLSTEQLFAYAANELDDTARAAVEAHAAACDFCLHQLIQISALVNPPPAIYEPDPRSVAAALEPYQQCWVACALSLQLIPLLAARARRTAFADTAHAPLEQPFGLDDEKMKGVFYLKEGEQWLHLEHHDLPSGTLLQVVVMDESGHVAWSHFVMLRQGHKAGVAEIRVDSTLPVRVKLAVGIMAAAKLTADAAAQLLTSFAQAQVDDPASIMAWQEWAARALAGDLDPIVCRALQEIHNTPAFDLPKGGVSFTTKLNGTVSTMTASFQKDNHSNFDRWNFRNVIWALTKVTCQWRRYQRLVKTSDCG